MKKIKFRMKVKPKPVSNDDHDYDEGAEQMASTVIGEMYGLLGEAELKEASEIEVGELTADKQKVLSKVLARFKGSKAATIWDGIHGIIFDLDVPAFVGQGRIMKDDLQFLAKLPGFRWLEISANGMSIGI